MMVTFRKLPENWLELFVTFLKEGQNRGFDPSVRGLPLRAHRALEPILKVGWNFWDFLFPRLELWENVMI
jgi:hypothetical protein